MCYGKVTDEAAFFLAIVTLFFTLFSERKKQEALERREREKKEMEEKRRKELEMMEKIADAEMRRRMREEEERKNDEEERLAQERYEVSWRVQLLYLDKYDIYF